jgi:multimeric flavodoxin WrbA
MIIGICGSPREQATEYVLKEALRMLNEKSFETQFWTVRGKWIEFCIHCDYCLTNKECFFQDEMQNLYPLLIQAKGIIFATPVYNGGISAQMKAVMDRTRSLVAADKNVFKGKIGMGIAIGGDRNGGQEFALMQIHNFYIINGIVPVGGGPFGANFGATFWSKDTLEGVKLDEEGFRSLSKTVKRFAAFMEKYGEK